MIAWELGAGSGHVASFRALVAALLADRHPVTCIVRDVGRAGRMRAPWPALRWWQAVDHAHLAAEEIRVPTTLRPCTRAFGLRDLTRRVPKARGGSPS